MIDESSALSSISPMVLLVCQIWTFYHCKMSKVRDQEPRETYEKICIDGNLKEQKTNI